MGSNSSVTRSPLSGPDDSMKSVLQVLKEISRKRIHSHIDEDLEDQSKRLRYTEAQFIADNASHTSLLQQTIQGKRAREDSSPTEDIKKRRKPSVNNEITASLSSSLAMGSSNVRRREDSTSSESPKRRRKRLDDSITTPVLGKLLKVQKEIVPPPTAVSTPAPAVQSIKEVSVDQVMIEASSSPAAASPPSPRPADDEHPASRLLGRFSGHERPPTPVQETDAERDPFSAVNDLGLSPPKENRLAAMIAVLGGPPDLDTLTSEKEPEIVIQGKALFTTPETPESPKQNKKTVTFAQDLTTTKIFERDSLNSKSSAESISPPSTPQVTTSNLSSAPVTPNPSSSSVVTNPGFSLSSPFATTVAATGSPTMFNSGTASTVVEVPQSKPMFGGSTKQNEVTSTAANTTLTAASTPSFITASQPTPSFLSSSSPAVAVNFPGAANVSTSESKPFSFGVSSSPPMKPEVAPKQTAVTTANNMFSFGNAKATESPGLNTLNTPAFGIVTTISDAAKPTPTLSTSAFGIVTTTSNVAKPTQKSEAASNFMNAQKPAFNLFNSISSPSVPPSTQPVNQTPVVNGISETTTASPFAPQQKPGATKPTFPAFGTNASSSPAFNFVSSSPATGLASQSTTTSASTHMIFSAKSESATTKPTTSVATTTQPNMFNNIMSTASESKPFTFGSQNASSPAFAAASSANNMFGNAAKPNLASTTQSNAPNMFGNPSTNPTSSSFGSAVQASGSPFGIALSNPTPSTQPGNMFGASTFGGSTPSATSGSQSTMFNSGSASTVVEVPQPKPMFGGSTTPAFGTPNSNPPPAFGTQNSNPPPAFGTPSTNPPPAFGTPSSNPPPAFGSHNNSAPSPFAFNNPSTQNQTTAAPSFGSQSGAPSFGAQTTTPGFGGQTTTASFGTPNTMGAQSTPSFGAQSTTGGFGMPNNTLNFGAPNTTPSFGNQSGTTGFGSQSGTSAFGASGPFNQATSTAAESKPAFGAASPFAFGNATNKEPAKPFASAAPFNFGPSAVQRAANPAPAFGSTNAFGNGQPAAFGAPAQPAAGGFNFNPPSAPTFQFSATVPQQPQAPGGGMFNIGSGSSAPRSKSGAVRRRTRT